MVQQLTMTTVAAEEVEEVPYVMNTFITVGVAPMAGLPRRRCVSLSPKGSRDAFASQFHSLLYKPVPVEEDYLLQQRDERIRWADEEEAEVEEKFRRVGRSWDRDSRETPSVESCHPTATGAAAAACVDALEKGGASESPDCGSTEAGSTTPGGESRAVSSSSSDASDQDPDEEELLRRVPRNEEGKLLSIGSIAHEDGTCKPCVFAFSDKKSCENGIHCPFCHFQHAPKKRVRLCKKKRDELKRQGEDEEENDVVSKEEEVSSYRGGRASTGAGRWSW